MHRKVSYHDTNIISCIEFFNDNDERHRENGPAYIEYNSSGTLVREIYCKNGVLHREEGPAFIIYDGFEETIFMKYIQNGYSHRINGPADIKYEYDSIRNLCKYSKKSKEPNGKIEHSRQYWLYGNMIDPKKVPFDLDKELTDEEMVYLKSKFC